MQKFHPILFSSLMVQAILEGRKIMTRRKVKGLALEWLATDMFTPEFVASIENEMCPYGKVGDVLWVRETIYAYGYWDLRYSEKKGRNEWFFVDQTLKSGLEYKYFDNPPEIINSKKIPNSCRWYKRPSIFIPKTACRIFLEITDIKVERLQDISEEDAISEGIESFRPVPGDGSPQTMYKHYLKDKWGPSPIHSFQTLWQKINGPKSWELNPFVWVISFKKIDKPENFK